ncbi:MAG: response regulator [Moraxellaceae bacterium]|nr:response regulator [Moraxellaceae bacterium]
MSFRDLPIGRKLTLAILVTSGVVLLLACIGFVAYESRTFRQGMVDDLGTLGRVVATNSTAALAFDNAGDARDVLAALRADPHIVFAGLYDNAGRLFATYPADLSATALPARPGRDGFHFGEQYLTGTLVVQQGDGPRLGTLYLASDLGVFRRQMLAYAEVSAVVLLLAIAIAYLLSRLLQGQILRPITALADVARTVSERGDYSIRAVQLGQDEPGQLTAAFNRMLTRIEEQSSALKESATRLRAVMDSALSSVIVIDAGGHIVDWNACAESMFGWSRTEAQGRDLAELIIPPRHREAHRSGLRRFRESGAAPVLDRLLEMHALRRNGEEFPVEFRISLLRNGDRVSFCGFITDITERRQAEARVQAQLSRLNLLHRITRAIGERQDLDSIFQVLVRCLEENLLVDFGCVFLYDAEAQLLTVSGVGGRHGDLAARLEMGDATQVPIDQNGLSRCVQGQLVYEPDIAGVHFPFPQRLAAVGLRSLVISPLLVESRVFGVLVAARETADGFSSTDCEFLRQLSEHAGLALHQVQLYDALRQAYEDLRQTQQAILQQERLRALGQMASGIAHDINNAISPMALYTEALLEREPNLSANARRYLETIQRAIDDVAQTVARMREFYRPRHSELSLAPVRLNGLVQQVLDLTQARWSDMPQQRGVFIDVQTRLAPDLPVFMGVEGEIREALTNLIFNAVDAIPGNGTVTIATGIERGEAECVYVEVGDTGVGMDEETRRKCLEPFFTTKGERGTGLGLAMVYGMVKRHSAEISIDSAPGRGTRIRLGFRVGNAVVGASEPGTGSGPRQLLRILVIDDDPLVINSLHDTLRDDGHAVITAEGGQKGIDAFLTAREHGEPFSVVITDLGMPYVDGRKVAEAVKAVAPDTPVIMLTGWGQRLVSDNEVPPEVDRVLSKPPRLGDLRKALREVVRET